MKEIQFDVEAPADAQFDTEDGGTVFDAS